MPKLTVSTTTAYWVLLSYYCVWATRKHQKEAGSDSAGRHPAAEDRGLHLPTWPAIYGTVAIRACKNSCKNWRLIRSRCLWRYCN